MQCQRAGVQAAVDGGDTGGLGQIARVGHGVADVHVAAGADVACQCAARQIECAGAGHIAGRHVAAGKIHLAARTYRQFIRYGMRAPRLGETAGAGAGAGAGVADGFVGGCEVFSAGQCETAIRSHRLSDAEVVHIDRAAR